MSPCIDPDRVGRLVERANGTDHFDALRAVAELQAVVRRAEDDATAGAVEAGLGYAFIARALCLSRQSVRAKYLTRQATGITLSPVERLAQRVAEWEDRRRRAEAYFDPARRRQEPT